MSKKEPPKRSKPLEIRTRPPPATRTPGRVELEYREGFGHLWPEDTKMPDHFHVRIPVPCPNCRRTHLTQHQQAVMCRATNDSIAYLVCRGCAHSFKMPVLRI